ncbi:MAG: DUF4829 domain-containing protein [Desulfitobacteriaceae bacterium]|nr:DUF4829 domain-containing protein [Desulfitobacteriaceae bacterium]
MKKILVIFGLIIISFIILIGYGNKNVSSNTNYSLEPKQVIENYFKYYNLKDRQGLLSTLTSCHDQSNMVFGFENLKFTKLVSIGNNDMNKVNAYLFFGRGKVNGVKENNVVSYKVTYLSLYSKNTPPWSSGLKNIFLL